MGHLVSEPLPHEYYLHGYFRALKISDLNVRPYRSVLVVSSASFSEEFVLLTKSPVSSASSSEEFVLLTELLHHSNSSIEFRSSISLVTNATSRHESMTTKVSIIFTKLLRISQLTGNLSASITAKFL